MASFQIFFEFNRSPKKHNLQELLLQTFNFFQTILAIFFFFFFCNFLLIKPQVVILNEVNSFPHIC